jgi:uncharacterized protein YdaU (DUF1376 family)
METKNNPWMPLYIGDYLKDTAGLTQAEHGAYIRLIMFYWNNSGPIPDDMAKIYRATGAISPEEQSNARSILQAFFKHEDGEYHHKRIDAEIARSIDGALKRKAKAFKASKARWDAPSIPTSNATSIPPSNARSNAPAMPYQNQSQSQNQSHIPDSQKSETRNPEVTKHEKPKRNTTSPFPHGEQCPDEWANWSSRNTSLTQHEIDRQFANARDWALSGNAKKSDWMAFWRKWCRTYEDNRKPNKSSGQTFVDAGKAAVDYYGQQADLERRGQAETRQGIIYHPDDAEGVR